MCADQLRGPPNLLRTVEGKLGRDVCEKWMPGGDGLLVGESLVKYVILGMGR